MSHRISFAGVLSLLGAACLPAAAQTSQDSINLERARAATREVDLLLSAPIDTGRVAWSHGGTAAVTTGGTARVQRLWSDPATAWVVWAGDTTARAPHFLIRRDGTAAYTLHGDRTSATAVSPELGKAMGLLRPLGPLPTGKRRAENAFRTVRGVQDTLVAVSAAGIRARAVLGPKNAAATDAIGSWIRIVGPRGWDGFVYPADRPLQYLEFTDAAGKLLFRFEGHAVQPAPLALDLGALRAPVPGRTLIDVARQRVGEQP